MERILALYDSDIFYVTRFMEYFNKKNETDFEISVFTRIECLEEFLRLNQVEILLSGNEINLEEKILKNIRYIYRLTDCAPAQDNDNQLSKYQTVGALMNKIIATYQDKENITQITPGSRHTNIISIFTPITGKEKLAFAWSLSYLMAEQVKVLLILLDLLPVPLLSQVDNQSQSMSEFIYYLKENSNITKMKGLLGQNGRLSYLSGILHGEDILSINVEDIQKWVEELRINSEYDTVIFYQGCYTQAMMELMKLSDTVLVTSLQNSYESAVLKEWSRQMSRLDINLKSEKFRFIYLQEQEEPDHVPITMPELMNSEAWNEAKQFLS